MPYQVIVSYQVKNKRTGQILPRKQRLHVQPAHNGEIILTVPEVEVFVLDEEQQLKLYGDHER